MGLANFGGGGVTIPTVLVKREFRDWDGFGKITTGRRTPEYIWNTSTDGVHLKEVGEVFKGAVSTILPWGETESLNSDKAY